ncbi:hypothetical protein F4680DRAFT_468661 [Xylaria scruposa]|nr:hypothetical protein F4680DRAFT_468661 [Xylaria scruposa]
MGNTLSMFDNVTKTNTVLLKSGKYSDLTLVCEGRKLRVHKCIVCIQSPVIAAALESNLKVLANDSISALCRWLDSNPVLTTQDVEINTIEVDFSLEALECMLYYMYTGDYKEEPAKHVRILQSAYFAQSVQPDPVNGTDQCTQRTRVSEGKTKPITSEALMYHAYVNKIADHYGVEYLSILSAMKIGNLLKERWSADAFCDFIEVVDLTRNEKIREIVVNAAVDNLPELVSKDIFSKGKVANSIAAEALKISAEDSANRENKSKGEVKLGRRGSTVLQRTSTSLLMFCQRCVQDLTGHALTLNGKFNDLLKNVGWFAAVSVVIGICCTIKVATALLLRAFSLFY